VRGRTPGQESARIWTQNRAQGLIFKDLIKLVDFPRQRTLPENAPFGPPPKRLKSCIFLESVGPNESKITDICWKIRWAACEKNSWTLVIFDFLNVSSWIFFTGCPSNFSTNVGYFRLVRAYAFQKYTTFQSTRRGPKRGHFPVRSFDLIRRGLQNWIIARVYISDKR
jgi:hypothetical protein